MSLEDGIRDRRWSLETDPNLAVALPGLVRQRLGRVVRRGLRGNARGRMRQRRTAPGGYHQVDAGELIGGVGLRVAEPLVLVHLLPRGGLMRKLQIKIGLHLANRLIESY